MHSFKDFGIKTQDKGFEGEKIRIDRILNKLIVIEKYKIEDSKFGKENDKCLHIQILVDNSKRVLFTGSGNLMEMIKQVPTDKFPFSTTIVKENERLEFT